MARPKRSSAVLQKAEKREAGLQSISDSLDLGNELTLQTYTQRIQALRSQIFTYNSTLSTLDNLSRDIKSAEQSLRDLSEQMLLGVAAKYGKNSGEYGKAGGVLKRERRRPMRKKTELATEPSQATTAKPITTVPFKATSEPQPRNGNGNVLVS
ncbi:MAG: hypothetical protein KME45_23720 [Stenomitos rutilans HA7619-LM2]|jgi:DNA repair ATPase RecN|nr:hypothetical protein [Stenomitos rutilans HA7619-LM2]